MMKKACYICLEGTEGVGKTTQTKVLTEALLARGFKVLHTKEPGTPLSPLTMELRNIMLNAKYEDEITPLARELVSQAIRSIHMDKVIVPAFAEYDYIVQDRGILSGLAYGNACGHDLEWLEDLAWDVAGGNNPFELYDHVIYLTGDVAKGLDRALSTKQEFAAGDAMEARGSTFIQTVASNMREYAPWFNTSYIETEDKSIDDVLNDILAALGIV